MDAAAELRRLRARAYGPDADIAADPVAMARLQKLEDAARAQAAAPPVRANAEPVRSEAPAPVAAVVPATIEAAETEEQADAAEADDLSSDRLRRWSRWSRRRTAVFAAIALVVIVVTAVGATSFVVRRSGYVAPVAAVLPPAPDRDIPEIFGITEDNSTVFADFAGMTPVASEIIWNGEGTRQCLLVAETELLDDGSRNTFPGVVYSSCGAGPFPATVTFSVGFDGPESLRDRYPAGSSLQFILEDGAVVVLAAPAAPAPAEEPESD